MTDDSLFLQFHDIIQKGPGPGNRLPVAFQIHIMNHAQIHIIRPQPLQQVFKGNPALLDISGAGVLPVLIGRSDMPLNNPAGPVLLNGLSDNIP